MKTIMTNHCEAGHSSFKAIDPEKNLWAGRRYWNVKKSARGSEIAFSIRLRLPWGNRRLRFTNKRHRQLRN